MTHGYEWFLEYDFVDLDFYDGDFDAGIDSFENELDDYENILLG